MSPVPLALGFSKKYKSKCQKICPNIPGRDSHSFQQRRSESKVNIKSKHIPKPKKMPPSPCTLCNKSKAILRRPKTGQQICRDCFFYVFETEVHNTIVQARL